MRWLPLLGWVLLVFGVSSIPDLSVPGNNTPGLDKLFHFGEYSVLGLLLGVGMRRYRTWRAVWVGALVGVVVATADELYQTTVPGRELDALDAVADTLGVITGALVWSAWTQRRQRTLHS